MDEAIRIPLFRANGSVCAYTLADAADAGSLQRSRWWLSSYGYAARGEKIDGRWQTTYLHRLLLGLAHGDSRFGDHINRDRLDNRRANLRVVPALANSQNRSAQQGRTSRYRGVRRTTNGGKWQAQISINGKLVHLGTFADEEEAARAASAARAVHMPFAIEREGLLPTVDDGRAS